MLTQTLAVLVGLIIAPSQTTQPQLVALDPQPVAVTTEFAAPNAGASFLVPDDWPRRPTRHKFELYRAERIAGAESRATFAVLCEGPCNLSAEQLAKNRAEEVQQLRRRLEVRRSGTVMFGDQTFYELAGISHLGRRQGAFVWRFLVHDGRGYVISLSEPEKDPIEAPDTTLGAVSDAVCGSLRLGSPVDPSEQLYPLDEVIVMPQLGVKLALPDAWRWNNLPREQAVMAACGLVDYGRQMDLPAFYLRMEYCPPGITAQQIAEGAFKAAADQAGSGQEITKLASGAAEMSGETAYDLAFRVAGDKPCTEARRVIVQAGQAVSLIVRYAGRDNARAQEMLKQIADTCEVVPQKKGR